MHAFAARAAGVPRAVDLFISNRPRRSVIPEIYDRLANAADRGPDSLTFELACQEPEATGEAWRVGIHARYR
jgi:hypothetical protein